jgi:hypothetical protein
MARISQFTLRLDWDASGKRWKLSYVVQLGRGVGSHWRWIECAEPLDGLNAARIADAVRREMDSWLPFEGPRSGE